MRGSALTSPLVVGRREPLFASLSGRPMRIARTIALLLAWLLAPAAAHAQEFAVVDVPSVTGLPLEQLRPRTIAFNDHRNDELADPGTGLIRFEDWARARPLQKQALSLYPGYVEPTFDMK